jgi:hypothetical protein
LGKVYFYFFGAEWKPADEIFWWCVPSFSSELSDGIKILFQSWFYF